MKKIIALVFALALFGCSATAPVEPTNRPIKMGVTNSCPDGTIGPVCNNVNGPTLVSEINAALAGVATTTGTAVQKANGSGGLTAAIPGTDYNQAVFISPPSSSTILNGLVKFTNTGLTTTVFLTDTSGAIGVVTAGAGVIGNATVQISGLVNCLFDGSTFGGHYVQISSSVAGDCHDAGAALPASGQVLGIVPFSHSGAGTYQMYFNSGSSATVSSASVVAALSLQTLPSTCVANVCPNTAFGAVNNSSTDDTTADQACINAVLPLNGKCVIPATVGGTCSITTKPLFWNNGAITLEIDGCLLWGGSSLKSTVSTACIGSTCSPSLGSDVMKVTTTAANPYLTGHSVYMLGNNPALLNGAWANITVLDSTHFTTILDAAGTTPSFVSGGSVEGAMIEVGANAGGSLISCPSGTIGNEAVPSYPSGLTSLTRCGVISIGTHGLAAVFGYTENGAYRGAGGANSRINGMTFVADSNESEEVVFGTLSTDAVVSNSVFTYYQGGSQPTGFGLLFAGRVQDNVQVLHSSFLGLSEGLSLDACAYGYPGGNGMMSVDHSTFFGMTGLYPLYECSAFSTSVTSSAFGFNTLAAGGASTYFNALQGAFFLGYNHYEGSGNNAGVVDLKVANSSPSLASGGIIGNNFHGNTNGPGLNPDHSIDIVDSNFSGVPIEGNHFELNTVYGAIKCAGCGAIIKGNVYSVVGSGYAPSVGVTATESSKVATYTFSAGTAGFPPQVGENIIVTGFTSAAVGYNTNSCLVTAETSTTFSCPLRVSGLGSGSGGTASQFSKMVAGSYGFESDIPASQGGTLAGWGDAPISPTMTGCNSATLCLEGVQLPAHCFSQMCTNVGTAEAHSDLCEYDHAGNLVSNIGLSTMTSTGQQCFNVIQPSPVCEPAGLYYVGWSSQGGVLKLPWDTGAGEVLKYVEAYAYGTSSSGTCPSTIVPPPPAPQTMAIGIGAQ